MKNMINCKWPKISIVILNWNGWKDTIECLESFYQISYPIYEIIVVDNGSIDKSIEKIREYCKGKIKVESKFFKYDESNKPIKIIEYTREESVNGGKESELENIDSNKKLLLIKNEKNYGFPEGNNIGIRFSLKNLNPKYICLLNNDTVVEKDFLNKLVGATEKDLSIGIIGPKILYYDHQEIINSAGAEMNWKTGLGKNIGIGEIDEGQYNIIQDTVYSHGACMLIKKEVFFSIGLLDERFFILFEDTDFSIRAKKQGYRCLYYPYAKIFHKEERSRKNIPIINLYYSIRNRILISRKYSNGWIVYILFLIFIGLFIECIRERRLERARAMFLGLLDGLFYNL
jgi:GT2 family glycosyltransferase